MAFTLDDIELVRQLELEEERLKRVQLPRRPSLCYRGAKRRRGRTKKKAGNADDDDDNATAEEAQRDADDDDDAAAPSAKRQRVGKQGKCFLCSA